MRTKAIILVAFFWFELSAIAQDEELKCFPPPGVITPSMQSEEAECFFNVRKELEAELNKTLQHASLVFEHNPRDLSSLRKTQRIWVTYRDAVCKATRDQYGQETVYEAARRQFVQLMDNMCVIRMTRARIADIKGTYPLDR